MEKKPLFFIMFLSLLILLISIIFNKSLSSKIKIISSIIIIITNFIVYFIFGKSSSENKIKKEKDLKEKLKKEKEKEEYERKCQERKKHIKELEEEGLTKINIQTKINVTNVAISINNYQEDKILITFFGGKLIIYSIDIINYIFNELLFIKEFSYNAYNSFEMKGNENRICVCGYPGIKIIETSINNLLGKENNSYKVIQFFDCSKYNKEIIKVIEINNESLISISTDYLLFWNRNNNNEYEINKEKITSYEKYENLLKISNILKIDEDHIVLLIQSNSNLKKSSVNFIKINDSKSKENISEVKILDLKITPLDTSNNNLCIINEKLMTLGIGCINGLGIISGKNMELIKFIEFDFQINNIDMYFNNSVIFFKNYEKENSNENKQNSYNFIQLLKDKENINDYQNKIIINKSSKMIEDDINIMKCFKDGIIIIGDHKGNLQLWH